MTAGIFVFNRGEIWLSNLAHNDVGILSRTPEPRLSIAAVACDPNKSDLGGTQVGASAVWKSVDPPDLHPEGQRLPAQFAVVNASH